MECSIECLVRGSGKIFTLLKVEGRAAEGPLTLNVATAEGSELPALLLPFEGAGIVDIPDDNRSWWVAITPQLAVTQTLKLTAEDGSLWTQRLTPGDAKWRSRLNYRLHPHLSAAIRDYDYARSPEQVSIIFERSLMDGDEMITRGEIRMAPETETALTVELLDSNGRPLGARYTLLGDRVNVPPDQPELEYRSVAFSLRTTPLPTPTVVSVRDESGFLPGFLVLDDAALETLRSRGYDLELNAYWDPAYDGWFRARKITESELTTQRTHHFAYEPVISFIVPLFDTPLEALYELCESVIGQSYPRWELILVNGSPHLSELADATWDLAAFDGRIRVLELEANRGIAGNTNAGIKIAGGDYIALLDHDDVIERDLLFEYVRALNADPTIDVLYCDEDKLTADGRYAEPLFKPDFSIDLERSVNYVCHLLCVSAALMAELGGLRSDYDGAQDHDLVLRAAERDASIFHVRKILYHWRIVATSTALTGAAKSYTQEAGLRAVRDHLERLGLAAEVRPYPFTHAYQTTYVVAEPHPLVSIIIPSKDSVALLRRCLDSIERQSAYEPYEVVIVENNSADEETFAYYREVCDRDDRVRVVTCSGPFNFAKLINFGVSEARGEYLLLLNNDVEVLTEGWLGQLVGICQRDEVGIVGTKLYYPDDTIQHAGVAMCFWVGPKHINKGLPRSSGGYFWLSKLPQNLSCVTGACMMTSRATFEAVGGFDEAYAVDFNDVDYCLKVREAGQLVVLTPDVELYHFESVSRGFNDSPDKVIRSFGELGRLTRRWATYFGEGDPYYNYFLDNTEAYYHLKW